MINLKLKTIASFIDHNDVVIDIGCDHAYLAIYLKENHLCKDVYASDVNVHALDVARKNIEHSHLEIKTYLADGFQGISNAEINTAVISGVGTNTIIDIIHHCPKYITKLILCSNNHHEELRRYLYQKSYYIQKEEIVFEKNKFYPIMVVTRQYVKENNLSLKYGRSRNQKYYLYLIDQEKQILSRLPKGKAFQKLKHRRNIKELEEVIRKI